MSRPQSLCRLERIPPDGARGFTVGTGQGRLEILAVRRGDAVYAYLNRCPHKGLNLDWVPDQFLSADHVHIQCATHGALFRIEDGFCVAGPCAGARLAAVTVRVAGGEVVLMLPAAGSPEGDR